MAAENILEIVFVCNQSKLHFYLGVTLDKWEKRKCGTFFMKLEALYFSYDSSKPFTSHIHKKAEKKITRKLKGV